MVDNQLPQIAPGSYKVLVVAESALEQQILLKSAIALTRAKQGIIRLLVITDSGEIPTWLNIPPTPENIIIQPVIRSGKNIGAIILTEISAYAPHTLFISWRGQRSRGRYQLGRVLDPVIQSALCDVIVQRGALTEPVKRILIPAAGGPNAPRGLSLARALAPLAEITTLYIADRKLGQAEVLVGQSRMDTMQGQLPLEQREGLRARVIQADTPVE